MATDFDTLLLGDEEEDLTPSPDDLASGEGDAGTRTRTRRRRSDAGKPRTTAVRGRKTSNAKLAESLMQPWGLVAKSLEPKSPTAAAVMLTRGEVTCDALVTMLEPYPRMRKALENVGKIGPATVILQTGIEIFMAVQLDFGKIPPEHPMAYGLGVSDLHAKVTPPVEQPFATVDGNDIFQTPPPPGFIPASDPRHPMYSFAARP